MQFSQSANCYKYLFQKNLQKIRSIADQSSLRLEKSYLQLCRRYPIILKIDNSIKNLSTNQKKFFKAVYLNIACLLLIAVMSASPANKMITPWVNSMQIVPFIDQSTVSHKTFAFAPGWSLVKLPQVKVDGLTTLSFYDIPVNTDGTLNFYSTGYEDFKSEQASSLFEDAHQKGVKVVVTLSQTDANQILQFLDDPNAQENLITQAITEVTDAQIDGVNIDFEYKGTPPGDYKQKLNNFVAHFSQALHSHIPGSIMTISLSNSLLSSSLYDPKILASNVDQVFMMDYDFAVTESNNNTAASPVYGGSSTKYWKQASAAIDKMLRVIPSDKLVIETAWYGNGNNYPLYIPQTVPSGDDSSIRDAAPLHTPLSQGMIDSLVLNVPLQSQAAAKQNLPYIAKALEDEGILNANVLAYALATIEHETAGTFQPIAEYNGENSARRLGYEGGTDYYGRGFIQLTHLRNYEMIGRRIGMGDKLAENPDLASNPEVAAKVLAAFFKDNNIANLASAGDFIGARIPINPDYNGYQIALRAQQFLYSIS